MFEEFWKNLERGLEIAAAAPRRGYYQVSGRQC